jgi:hypothetical protein
MANSGLKKNIRNCCRGRFLGGSGVILELFWSKYLGKCGVNVWVDIWTGTCAVAGKIPSMMVEIG